MTVPGDRWRSRFNDSIAVVKEIRGNRILVVVDGNREWLTPAELKAGYKLARR